MNERKPHSSFPKVRARTKRREGEASPRVPVSLKADQAFRVVERRAGSSKGVVAFHVITRSGPRKKPGAAESDSVSNLLGQIDFQFRKRKRGK